jgi:NAD(P)-dependent dehydrogenase (short-subunit alcohol dehydrogenase family)
MSDILDGKIALVTGAGGGIGRAHALALAAAGARVVVNDIGDAAGAVADEIRAAGGEAIANTADITDYASAESLVGEAVAHFGGLDVVVNNAGILRDRMLVNMSEQDWDDVVRVHLRGTFLPAKHAATYWRTESRKGRTRRGRIINTSSASGLFGNVGQANYGAAKAGIAAFTVIAAAELGRYGVTVNAVSPTAYTRMTENLSPELKKFRPEDVSPIVVWLASDFSEGVTGRIVSVRSGRISVLEGWVNGPTAQTEVPHDIGELDAILRPLVDAAPANAAMDGTRPA